VVARIAVRRMKPSALFRRTIWNLHDGVTTLNGR